MPKLFPWPRLITRTVAGAALGALLLIGGCRQRQNQPTPARTPRNANPRGTNPATPARGAASNDGHLLLGNPSDAGRNADNFLLQRAQYVMSYSASRGEANWVSWHTDASDLGDTDRGGFAPDPDLPNPIRPADYRGAGYDRGHICPSGDRTNNRDNNDATFYMSNMLPQAAQLNQHVWKHLEDYVRDQVRAGYEAYQVAGGAGNAGTIAGGRVVIPEVCWKIIVLLPVGRNDLGRINAQTRVIAVGMPNVKDERLARGDWHSYITTASKIEAATGLRFFAALPASTRAALERKTDSGQ